MFQYGRLSYLKLSISIFNETAFKQNYKSYGLSSKHAFDVLTPLYKLLSGNTVRCIINSFKLFKIVKVSIFL